jgi:RNA polymerase sigma-70 factor (ECF subfamily)
MNETLRALAGGHPPGCGPVGRPFRPLAAEQSASNRPAAETRALSTFRCLLDAVWLENQPRLMKLAIGLGLRGEQAADVLHDVYVMVAQKPPAIHEADELRRWLFRVTVNRCHLEHRRRGHWQRLWRSFASSWSGEHQPAVAHELDELKLNVERALATLEKEDRALVVLRYFSELNSREIAQIVGLPDATVRGRLRAARRILASELGEWNDAE